MRLPKAAGHAHSLVRKLMRPRRSQVFEQGMEAAAVTAIVARTTAVPTSPPEAITFDRPFATAVVHGGSGTVLFLGEVQAPEQWSGGRR